MFTGIVEEVGVLRERIPSGPAIRLRLSAPRIAPGLKLGDSVSCNGVCLTVEEILPDGFSATAVPETLARTTLGKARVADAFNLEPALKAGSPMGGHIVQGHIDGVATVTGIRELPGGGGKELSVRVPSEFSRYCVEKGSFALHGASLTIAGVEKDVLRFALVPHTLAHTNLGKAAVGDKVNFEVDLVGKYVEKMLGYLQVTPGKSGTGNAANADPAASGLDAGRMEKWGYGL